MSFSHFVFATIEYRLSSSFLPILATLRENDVNGTIVQSKVLQQSGILESILGAKILSGEIGVKK